jgi:integrase/recombinase XerD
MQKSQKPLPQHVSDFLDWLEIEKGLSTKSQENYSRFINKFISWLKDSNLSSLTPDTLTPDHIRQYRLFLSRNSLKPLKKSTQNYYLIALRSLLNYFADRDILSLPSEKIKLARDKEDRQVRFLTLEQLQKLFEAPDIKTFQGLRDRTMLETFFSTGMRISELVALNTEQINIKPNTEELELTITGKGGRIRTVYFSARTLEWLQRYLKERKDVENALFVTYKGKKKEPHRITPRAIQKALKKYTIIAGIPLFTTPHVIRHTFATDLLAQGVDLRTIQEFLGHKSITATQIYAHVTSQKLREIHEKFHSGKNLK